MSQLNNDEGRDESIVEEVKEEAKEEIKENVKGESVKEENKSYRKPKKSTLKLWIIIFIVFTILLVTATVVLIKLKSKTDNKDSSKPSETPIEQVAAADKKYAIQSLTERYVPNGLKIETKEYKLGKLPNDKYGYEVYKVTASYVEISGLKDTTLQNKINAEIKNKIISMADKEYSRIKNKAGAESIINAMEYGNFADVLSIGIYMYASDTENQNIYGLNYRLDNGEKIKFKDIFTSDTSVNSIIADAKYEELAYDKMTDLFLDMSKIDTSSFEDEIMKTIRLFENTKDIEFSFSERYIYLNIAGKELYIDMSKHYQSIAIYKRFKSNSQLYTNPVNIKLFVFTSSDVDYIYKFGEESDNLFLDINRFTMIADSKYESKANSIVKNRLDELIKDIKTVASKNKNKGIIYYIITYMDFNEEKNIYEFNSQIYTYTMSIDYYNSNYLSFIADAYRQQRASIEITYSFNSEAIKNKKIIEKYEHISEKYDLNGNLVKDTDNENNDNSTNQVDIYGESI